MALVIEKRLHRRRKQALVVISSIGVATLIGAPLSYALTVQAPSTSTRVHTLVPTSANKNKAVSTASQGKTAAQAKLSSSAVTAVSTNCTSSQGMRTNLSSATSSELKKLAEYEQVCGSSITNQLSFFVSLPTTVDEAHAYAADVIAQLKEFSAYGISPLVFLEPTTSSGGLVDMATYESGVYDSAIDTYFATIKAAQVTDAMMGTWVPFPEGNTPVWTSLSPNDFAASVTKTVSFQKKYFPGSKASIMLDTLTYPTSGSWEGGQARSFLPYIQNIPPGLIDSFGLQGFPWSPPANEGGSTNGTPQQYLRTDLAAEAARALHTQNIWLNTGTFSVKYANQAGQQVTVSPTQRLALLTDVVSEAKGLQNQGFSVAVHLFAENKANVAEATDWSYWLSGQASTSSSTYVFKAFVHSLQADDIPLWLFDTDETS
jgi:hypothetical protein